MVEIADAVLALQVFVERNVREGLAVCVSGALVLAGVGEDLARKSRAARLGILGAVGVLALAQTDALVLGVAGDVLCGAVRDLAGAVGGNAAFMALVVRAFVGSRIRAIRSAVAAGSKHESRGGENRKHQTGKLDYLSVHGPLLWIWLIRWKYEIAKGPSDVCVFLGQTGRIVKGTNLPVIS
jgi:hypothetical protein